MIQKVLSFTKQHHMIEQNDHIIIGVSGGADSVCLLTIMDKIKEEKNLKFTVVHVEHGIRGEDSLRDAKFVQELCDKMGIICLTYRCKAVEYARENGFTVEEGARNLRYHYFLEALKQCEADKIAVAHNQNDVAETMLFHLTRGTGLRGLCGIVPVRENIIRPLLCVSRAEIEEFLQLHGLKYCEDKTNFEMDYTRNKIRHQILPAMEEINKKTVAHMYRTAEIAAQSLSLTEWASKQAAGKYLKKSRNGYEIDLAIQNELPMIGQMVILHAISELAKSRKDISSIHMEQVFQLFDKPVGRQTDLPYKLAAKRSYDGVIIYEKVQKKEEIKKEIYPLHPNQVINLPEYGYNISVKILEKENDFPKIEKKAYTKWFDYDKIKGNVQLRNRQSGDYIIIDKTAKKQKLNRYFINEKIPKEQREQILLLADDDHILWVIGHRISEDCKVTEHTNRILEVQIDGGKSHE